jgi:hypothetical protein
MKNAYRLVFLGFLLPLCAYGASSQTTQESPKNTLRIPPYGKQHATITKIAAHKKIDRNLGPDWHGETPEGIPTSDHSPSEYRRERVYDPNSIYG